MAEQEVIKHSRKIYKIWQRPATWKHKAREFLIEILIIVFAISLSLLLDRWREKKHEQNVAADFLAGLKTDLEGDIAVLNNLQNSYESQQKAFYYFKQIIAKNGMVPADDSAVDYVGRIFFSFSTFQPKAGRFEGLKSAGQLNYIDNKILLNEILTLYQDRLPWLVSLITSHVRFKTEKLVDYYDTHLPATGSYSYRLTSLLKQPVMQRYMERGSLVQQIIDESGESIEECRAIIRHIDEEIK